MADKALIIARVTAQIARAANLRAAASSDPKAMAARQKLRAWQAERLARTHADLVAHPRFGDAAQFFLTDIYGANDQGARDAEIQRVVPTAAKVLSVAGIETVANAIELDALSEDLDAAMVTALGRRVATLDAAAYGKAYRKVDRRPDRERQIALIEELGQSLDRLTRQPFISATLTLMRKPAQLAGLGNLQNFLERGFTAFRKMGKSDELVGLIASRERKVLEALFAGDDSLLCA
jgi:hypothetical protein